MWEHEIFLRVACSRNQCLDYHRYCQGDSSLMIRYLFHSSYSDCRCTVSIETSLLEFSIRSRDDVNVKQYRGIQTLHFISHIGQSFGDVNRDKDYKLTHSRADKRSSLL